MLDVLGVQIAVDAWPLVLGIVVASLIILGSTAWTYRDTRQHHRQTVLWTAIVFTLPFIGFAVYLLVGRGQLE